jgi:SpoVK/Ycf46/Vps4 family AAA+-type ATPase
MSQAVASELTLLLRSGWRIMALESFEEDRALRVLERAARAAERKLVTWSVSSGLGGQDSVDANLSAGLRRMLAVDEPTVFALLDAQRLLGDDVAVRLIRDLLPTFHRKRQTLAFVGPVCPLPLELEREAGHVELPLPRAEELEQLFAKVPDVQAEPGSEVVQSAVRAALGLTAAEAVRVLRKACQTTGGLNDETPTLIAREKRQALRRTPSLTYHDTDESMKSVGGMEELKRWLGDRRRAFGIEARQFGLPAPRGLLLLGVQGCGKSLCAKAVALEWQFPLLRLDLASVFSGTDQSPEAAIREATAVAESIAPAVLWIDEIEKGFSASGNDPKAARVFGSFLTWLSEKRAPVFVVATANDVSNLPPELLRRGRFDELFFVDLPTLPERIQILSIHLAKRGRDPMQYNLEMLAHEADRLSGAEIEQVVAAGLYTAFAEERELTDIDLQNAIGETVPLYDTYEDSIKELRDWARVRARAASLDPRMVDLFHPG